MLMMLSLSCHMFVLVVLSFVLIWFSWANWFGSSLLRHSQKALDPCQHAVCRTLCLTHHKGSIVGEPNGPPEHCYKIVYSADWVDNDDDEDDDFDTSDDDDDEGDDLTQVKLSN